MFLIIGCAGKKSLKEDASSNIKADTLSIKKETRKPVADDTSKNVNTGLSEGSKLMIRACDNYLSINSNGQKSAEVLNIKASLLYNNKLYERSRLIYNQIITNFPKTTSSYDAMQMIAQSYYEEKRFNEAQEWYRKLSYEAQSLPDKEDALRRIAESIFRMAESYEDIKSYKDAVVEYERVSLEFPESNIADIALFNAGLNYEKLTDWTHAILIFQRLIQKYPKSQLLAKAQFRIAKNHEKLLQWDYAAEAYLKVVLDFPTSELGPLALYNAGFCFESADKLKEAAAAFEKLASVYPQAPDAPDVLFKAGEIYGKIKDWASVTRVNQTFTEKFGADEDRIIQALCMSGIALYMQGRDNDAIRQLEKAVFTFGKLKNTSSVNAFYTAKALYSIGEIYHGQMSKIELSAQRGTYKKQLQQKSLFLDKAMEAYGKVIKFSISEWTTRAVFQIGQIYEDFGIGVFRQERPSFNSFEERMALELGIAQAVEQYFVDKALYYHELNVKLGIKEELEDKYITQSRLKLTYLPYMAGENYLSLVQIIRNAEGKNNLEGFSSVAKTLQLLQKVAPFQEKAIDLYLKCLELGTKYSEMNEFYNKAASTITTQSFMVGETYDKVVTIAREAPVPDNFNNYEQFVYKTKLLKQVEDYEDQALTHYLKTMKISDAYKIIDKSVSESQARIARLLFNKAMCYDLLATKAFSDPPYPGNINDAEKEEFNERFNEIGTKFRSQAIEIYKTVMDFFKQRYASGDFVRHTYMRLYQISPEIYGVSDSQVVLKTITSDTLWKYTDDTVSQWFDNNYNDSSWSFTKANIDFDSSITGFPGSPPASLKYEIQKIDSTKTVFFRRKFEAVQPCSSVFYIAVNGKTRIFVNHKIMLVDTNMYNGLKVFKWNVTDKISSGGNCLAIEITGKNKQETKIYPALYVWEKNRVMLPKPPDSEKPWTYESGKSEVYKFPFLKNFSINAEQK